MQKTTLDCAVPKQLASSQQLLTPEIETLSQEAWVRLLLLLATSRKPLNPKP